MTVLVDTTVWSLLLRRRASPAGPAERRPVDTLRDLIGDGEAALIGPVRQEILSGIREEARFLRLREVLSHFPVIRIEESDYDRAAESFNACRRAGISATSIGMLICAVAIRANVPVFTTDADFGRYAGILGLMLFQPQTDSNS